MIEILPEYLRERARVNDLQVVRSTPSDNFVLYWLRTAVRADENPALDVARWIAENQGVPLLVYHAISDHYEYASDRHHTFMLQGARDVQCQFAELGISYAFHLVTHNDRQLHLLTLANMASVVVTEDMPVDPPRRFLNALKRKTNTPIVCVDTACVAPMQLVKKAYTRAFEFRSATEKIYAERLTRPWPELNVQPKPFDLSTLVFEPADLQSTNLAAMVARCEIDHSVGPVVDTVGGSAAGYQRWEMFKEDGLARYAKQRNNALLDGVSRLSAYLHYGMVSPFRIARESARLENAGAGKYLDELLIWRELAYAFCFYRNDHDRWSAIPDWAQQTLNIHASDRRDSIYSWEQLARGATQDEFWNAAQRSLLMQGELHNNVRMTWGKAILNWTATPEQALETIIDLNHRYALDGRDPASYGGILWCLGQFDRPFEPEQKIFGSVRPRPTTLHASRLDPNLYRAKVTRPRFDTVPHVAVIGAGISGLFAARTLQDHGLNVTVFEKSRGVGGRMSTRRIESGDTFDHGAQYFTARDKRFFRYVTSWAQQGIVAKWPDQGSGSEQKIVVFENGLLKSESNSEDRFVAVPCMNSICSHLAAGLQIRTQTHIANVTRMGDEIELFDESQACVGKFHRLIVSSPAAQAAQLLADLPEVAGQISKIQMNPCWAAMVAFTRPITDQWVGAFLHDSFLSWAARDSTKPGRNHALEHLVIHANSEWTAKHWEFGANEIAWMMLDEFWRVTGISPQTHSHLQAHRWKYAIPADPSDRRYFADESAVTIACGDWASGSRVEGAFLSGMAAAGRILGG
ncbi:MAG: FAD-dependent oxidoreductase, partial [Aureliella sp.]